MTSHIKVVGVLFVVFGTLGVVAAAFSTLVLNALATMVRGSGEDGAAIGGTILGLGGALLTVALLAYSIPAIIGGWGLVSRKSWARVLCIVLAAVSLIKVPVGTIFGIYALWVLFNKETEALFVRV